MDMLDKLEESPMLNRPLPNRAKGVNEDWDAGLVPEPADGSRVNFGYFCRTVIFGLQGPQNLTMTMWIKDVRTLLEAILRSEDVAALTSGQLVFIGKVQKMLEVWVELRPIADQKPIPARNGADDMLRAWMDVHDAWTHLD